MFNIRNWKKAFGLMALGSLFTIIGDDILARYSAKG